VCAKRPSSKKLFNDGNIVGEKEVLGFNENAKTFTSRFWWGAKYPLTSFVQCYFSVHAPLLDSIFKPSTSKVCPTTWPHPFEDHVIMWPHLFPSHQTDPPIFVFHPPLQTIIDIHVTFVVEPCFISCCWLQHHWHDLQHDLHFATRYMFCKKWWSQIMFEISFFLDVKG